MVDAQPTPLAPDAAARLVAFARACKGAARAVALYPPEHPAIGESLNRLSAAASAATLAGPLALMVLPDNLQLGGRSLAKPDPAVVELAALLHAHMVGELKIQPNVEPAAWRTLLALVGRDPLDVRAHGGIARSLTTAGGIGIEITEIDYSGLIKDRKAGDQATWDEIIQHCLHKDALDLDEETLKILGEICGDPARLAEFYARAEDQPAQYSTRDKCEGLLKALRGVVSYYTRVDAGRLESLFDNMSGAVSHLSPEFVLEMLTVSREPGNANASLVTEIVQRITSATIGRFVARSVERERACTARLTDAFRALAPDRSQQASAAEIAREQLSRSPLGSEPGFEKIWDQVEHVLLSYDDKNWVSDSYNQELSSARAHASEMEHITDDPPERIVGWLGTVSDVSVRALDLQLLGDLLVVERNAARRQEMLQLVIGQVDELVVLGDFEGARRLVDAVRSLASPGGPVDGRSIVARSIEQIVSGQFMPQVTVHLNGVKDEEFEQVKALCASVGPTLVPRLAETLSSEARVRARQRLTDLLVAFGEHGRGSVAQLRQSPLASVRRTAVQLLRSFGGPESLPDLEALVNDADSGVQREAARALIGFGFDESFSLLARVLSDSKQAGRASVIDELGTTRDQKAKPLFCYLVRRLECKGTLREAYLQALGRLGFLGGPDSVEVLAEVLRRGQWWAPMRTREVRTCAAEALAQIRLPEAQDALRDAAANGSFGVRSIAKRYVRSS